MKYEIDEKARAVFLLENGRRACYALSFATLASHPEKIGNLPPDRATLYEAARKELIARRLIPEGVPS